MILTLKRIDIGQCSIRRRKILSTVSFVEKRQKDTKINTHFDQEMVNVLDLEKTDHFHLRENTKERKLPIAVSLNRCNCRCEADFSFHCCHISSNQSRTMKNNAHWIPSSMLIHNIDVTLKLTGHTQIDVSFVEHCDILLVERRRSYTEQFYRWL